MALNWTKVEDAIRAWFLAGSGLPSSRVIWSRQNGAQPAMPYATLAISGPRKLGSVDELADTVNLLAPAGQEVTQTVVGRREITVTCQAFTAGTVGDQTAKEYLSQALTALDLPSIRSALNSAGLAPCGEDGILDISALLETKWQGRASMDVRFYCVDTVAESTGYIASANLVDQVE